MTVLVMIGQLLLGLSILVALHELGHLVAAKVFGMRVEQYSIGFPPKIWGKTFGETEYSIGAIPMGGFVKIAGMMDESMDTEQLKTEPQPWEFRSKPAWQRLIVMLGGIFVNVVTGIIIFTMILFVYGESFTPITETKGIVVNELGKELGLKNGDKILKINGEAIKYFEDIRSSKAMLGTGSYYTIDRAGKTMDIQIPDDFIEKLSDDKYQGAFVAPALAARVDSVIPTMTAAKAGLKPGDVFLTANAKPLNMKHEVQEIMLANAQKPVAISVLRGADTLRLSITPDKEGKLGFYTFPKEELVKYSFGQSLSKGTGDAFKVVYDNVKGLKKIFSGKVRADKALSGPFEIASKFYGGVWIWKRFWFITGVLSMALAFMNLLPIPALDGGHTVFLLYEMVTGKAPSDKFLEYSQKIGMAILLTLMAFVILNGAYKTIFKNLF